MDTSSPTPPWPTAESLRSVLLERCYAYCRQTGTGFTILSVMLCGASSWLTNVEAGSNLRFDSYDRAMRKLDELEAMNLKQRAGATAAVGGNPRRVEFIARCNAFCAKHDIDRRALSVKLRYGPDWLDAVASGDIMAVNFNRAAAQLDKIMRTYSQSEATTNGKKTAPAKAKRTRNNRQSNRRKGSAIRGADRKPDGRSRQRTRAIDAALPADS